MLEMNIKKLMMKNDLTVTEISNLTNISRTTINNLVNGKSEPKALQLETLYKLSAVFCVPIDDLFKKYKIDYDLVLDMNKIKILNSSEKDTIVSRIPITVFYKEIEMLHHFLDVKVEFIMEADEEVLFNVKYNDTNLKWDELNQGFLSKQYLNNEHDLSNRDEVLKEKLNEQLAIMFEESQLFETVFNFSNKKITLIY